METVILVLAVSLCVVTVVCGLFFAYDMYRTEKAYDELNNLVKRIAVAKIIEEEENGRYKGWNNDL